MGRVSFTVRSLFRRRRRREADVPEPRPEEPAPPRTDRLTGLPGPAAVEEEIRDELARSERGGYPLSLAAIDLDGFTRLNEERGRQAGDRLLKRVAAAWRSELRGGDIVVRYADDEFLVVLPNCTPANARSLVDRLVRALPPGQTCSAGVAHRRAGDTVARLLSRARKALDDAKRAGRAQVVAR